MLGVAPRLTPKLVLVWMVVTISAPTHLYLKLVYKIAGYEN